MHDGNRGDHTKTRLIAGLIVSLLFCVVWIGYGLSESAKYERHAYNQNGEYAEYTGDKVAQTCVGISAVEKAKCLDDAFEKQREYEASQQDLVAQRQSALWAFIMGAAAVIGMALSAVGVFLVWTTFDATRKANAIANDALDGQLRPWVDFETSFLGLEWIGGNIRIRAKSKFKNMGTSPALYLTYVATLMGERWLGERVFNHMSSLFDGDVRKHHDRTFFPGDPWDRGFNAKLEEPPTTAVPLMLVVAVRYRSPYSKRYRYTCKIYDVRDPNHRDGFIEPADADRRYNGIVMRERDRSGSLAT